MELFSAIATTVNCIFSYQFMPMPGPTLLPCSYLFESALNLLYFVSAPTLNFCTKIRTKVLANDLTGYVQQFTKLGFIKESSKTVYNMRWIEFTLYYCTRRC